jgi:prolipoprotein diacylglyceryl transferase
VARLQWRLVVASLASFLAYIPSPSRGVFYIGPIPLHVYGLMLAIGVLAATRVAEIQWARAGHDPKDIAEIAVGIVIGGVVGARVYHLMTDYQLYTHDWVKALKIWDGGLSMWGVLAGGIIAVVILTRRRHYDTLGIMDALAPGIVLAQAIGRWGNYFNQELFGTPSKLPWALKIDPTKRPAGYVQYSTFHPTFLYESLYCLAIFGFLLWVSRRFRLYRGQMAALYIALYTFGRFWFENMRIDPAHHVGGLRINAWVSLGVFFVAVAWFVVAGRRGATAHDDKARNVTGDTDANEPRPERVAAD